MAVDLKIPFPISFVDKVNDILTSASLAIKFHLLFVLTEERKTDSVYWFYKIPKWASDASKKKSKSSGVEVVLRL